MLYLGHNDAVMRLDNCVVRYKGLPVFLQACPEDFGFRVRHYDRKKDDEDINVNKAYESGDLNIKAFSLGYMNMGMGVVTFLTRLTARKQKQGLHTDNCRQIRYQENDPDRYTVHPCGNDILRSTAFFNMVMGIYPDFNEAMERVKKAEHPIEVAVNRRTVLYRDELGVMKLKHWNLPIGFITGDNEVRIPKKFRLQGYAIKRELASYPLKFVDLEV